MSQCLFDDLRVQRRDLGGRGKPNFNTQSRTNNGIYSLLITITSRHRFLSKAVT